MSQDRTKAINSQIAEQAAEWLDVLETAGPDEQAAFAEWVAESPSHLREFLFVSAIENELSQVDPRKEIDVRRLLQESGNVVPIGAQRGSQRSARPRIQLRIAAAMAITTLGLGSFAWSILRSHPGTAYTTAIGEQRTIELADGSVLQLNSQSRIKTALSTHGRDIQLLEGEATFKVAPDPARPFRVHADSTTIQAIGTQFNVNRRPSGLTVSVIEGRVRIFGRTPATLAAGDEARVDRKGQLARRNTVDPASISAWRQHRLVFRDDTLEDIVAEFNRHNVSSQIRIEGSELVGRRYTAVFDANDPSSLVAFLRQDDGLAVEEAGTLVRIRPRITGIPQ